MSELENQKRKILIVDDDIDNLHLVSEVLLFQGYQVDKATSGEQALASLNSILPHLVLLDVNMPGISGLETLEYLRRKESYVSIIMVTGQSKTEDVVRGLDAGADDYICKPFNAEELLARVRAQLRIKDLNDQLQSANARLQELVDRDDLTGLFNMRSLYQRLDHELARGRRFSRPVAVVMMDMDNFKNVNDEHDHLFGSHVLAEIGKLISENIRRMDFAARYGGDEFLIVLSETTPQGSYQFTERLRQTIEGHQFQNSEHAGNLTASFGVAVTPADHTVVDARTLVRAADNALYQAKANGKNCIYFYDFAVQENQRIEPSMPQLFRKKRSGT